MKCQNAAIRLMICGLVLLVAGAGCTLPKRAPVYLSTNFDPLEIEQITVLQPLDLRYDKSLETDFVKILGKTSKTYVKKRKYKTVYEDDPKYIEGITEADLEDPSAEWIRNLGPEDAGWVLLPSIEYVTRFTTADSEALAEVKGVLFDKAAGNVAWRGVGKGFTHVGIIMGGLADNDAVRFAGYDLYLSLPGRKDLVTEYRQMGNPAKPLNYKRGTMPEAGMSKMKIEEIFGPTNKIESHDIGETWYYHLNMGKAYIPFMGAAYIPDVWVFHFDKEGNLLKYHFTDQRISNLN